MGCHDGLRITDEELTFRERLSKLRKKLKVTPLSAFMASDFAILAKKGTHWLHDDEIELLEKRIAAYESKRILKKRVKR